MSMQHTIYYGIASASLCLDWEYSRAKAKESRPASGVVVSACEDAA